MAENTLAGLRYENVARAGFDTLVDALVPFVGFTRDLSTDAVEQGTVVKTRIVPTVTPASVSAGASYSAAISAKTFTEVSVTLDQHYVGGFAFNNRELAAIEDGVLSDTTERAIKASMYGVANQCLDYLWALVTSAYTASVTVAASGFDADYMADLMNACAKAGFPMGLGPVCMLDPDYYTALVKDNAIQDKSASGVDALITGTIPMCAGFKVHNAVSLPGAAANNTVGFGALPDAIAIAMRGMDVDDDIKKDFIEFEVLKDDVTGIVATFSVWVDRDTRKKYWAMETMYGASRANTNALKRITSS